MNNGKICVSICAETAEALTKLIKRAEHLADVIEIRFDCLKKSEIQKARNLPASKRDEICTFRPQEQGGNRFISLEERVNFWNSGDALDWVDFEADLYELNLTSNHRLTICSQHDFNGVPENLDEIYNKISATNADILKIAVQTDDITESLAVWKLLEKAKSANKQIVSIAMGEAGKWTRILGLANGAPITYAALDADKETAPGQLTVREMVDVYRVKELNEETEIYGIVGNPISHSLSPFIQNTAFKFCSLNAVYIPFQVKNLDAFIKRMVRGETREIDWNLKGFSVTIPHKQSIIDYLDETDETSRKIGAVNTVRIENGKLFGYNTDADGFIEPLKTAYGDLQDAKVAVLGNGGAARAIIYALKKEGASVTIFARNLEKSKLLTEEFDVKAAAFTDQTDAFADYDIVVNATPLGTKGELERQTPALAAQIKNVRLIYDLNYNPFETVLIKEAYKAAVPTIGGVAMLIAQGAKQFEIWTGKTAPISEMSKAAFEKLQK